MTDRELAQQAEAALKATTVSYPTWATKVAAGKYNPPDGSGTQWGKALAALAQIGAAAPAPAPEPALTGRRFSISPPYPLQASLTSQLQEAQRLGLDPFPRIAATDQSANECVALGITEWCAYVQGPNYNTFPSVDSVINYCKKYPKAWVEPQNELNLVSVISLAEVAAKHIELYKAMKAAGLPNKLMLSSVGNSISSSATGSLHPLEWCRRLAAAGCKFGTAFDVANYHMYDADPQFYDNWMHVWTPNAAGESCQEFFGNPPFLVTEFGARVGTNNITEATQAAAVTKWVTKLSSVPDCLGGHWFCLLDANWSGFGIIRTDGTHRPAYDAYRTAMAA
jgi:hypothetical protein